MVIGGLRLVPDHFRFVGVTVIRSRCVYYAVVLGGLAALVLAVALGADRSGAQRFATLYLIGLMMVPGPLTRSWVNDDVRLGYGAWWLQKPVRPLDLYLARLLATVGWAVLATLALTVSLAAGMALGRVAPTVLLDFLIGFGWFPTLIVVLAFLSSALGARNAALPAYGAVLASAGLQGAGQLLEIALIRDGLAVILPPYRDVVDTVMLMASQGRAAALPLILPVYAYSAVCAVLGVTLSLRVPRRLARAS